MVTETPRRWREVQRGRQGAYVQLLEETGDQANRLDTEEGSSISVQLPLRPGSGRGLQAGWPGGWLSGARPGHDVRVALWIPQCA